MTFARFLDEETQKSHIKRYTDMSQNLNQALWQHHKDGTKPPSKIDKHDLAALDKIARKNILTKNTWLYSGLRHDPTEMMDSNNIIHFPSFLSTSEELSVATIFAIRGSWRVNSYLKPGEPLIPADILAIKAKKGQYAADLSKKSIEKESERMLPRNTKIKVNPNPEIFKNGDYFNGIPIHIKPEESLRIWTAEIVSQEWD